VSTRQYVYCIALSLHDALDVSDCKSIGSTIVMDVSRDDSSSPGDLVIDKNISAEAAEG
jgi:hypothetical protein